MPAMLPVDEARNKVLSAVKPLAPIELPLAEAGGCVLAHDAISEFDIPPFSTAALDGLACRSADIYGASPKAPIELRLAGEAMTDGPPGVTVGWGEAVRIVAGAVLPAGADCVVPGDRYTFEGETAHVTGAVDVGDFVSPAGEDVRASEVLVGAGRRLSAPELALLAAAGYARAFVHPKARVAVASLGDVVEPGAQTAFGRASDAGSFALLGALREAGAAPHRIGIVQRISAELRGVLQENVARADCFACAGADSPEVGAVLSDIASVERLELEMYPPAVLRFGFVEGVPFFGLPSRPVSLFIAYEVLARPAILKILGRRDLDRPTVLPILDQDLLGPYGVRLYLPTRVFHREGAWHAELTSPSAPDRLGALVRANGFINGVEAGAKAGDRVPVRLFRALAR
ncbi:MAG: molybdopterin molybdotransferase MoeA [Actinomycetota bacterium]